ncbi:MAG TPA: DUF4142 domain-containing protein [Chryseosolibacter sp.]
MKNIFYIYGATLAASLVLASCNDSERRPGYVRGHPNQVAADRGKLEAEDRKKRDSGFTFETVANQYGEIKLAELAVRRSRTPEIRKLAERIIADHSASLNKLKTLAQARSFAVPVEENDGSKKMLEKISHSSANEFDEQWCAQLIGMHDESIGKFQERLNDTADRELKAYIGDILPLLKDHLKSLKGYRENLARQK